FASLPPDGIDLAEKDSAQGPRPEVDRWPWSLPDHSEPPIEGRAMAMRSRAGTGLLLVGGLALAALMVYTLAMDGGRAWGPPWSSVVEADVAVLLPGGVGWLALCMGLW